MSENCLGGTGQQSEGPINNIRTDAKTMLQYTFNGLTSSQNSSRGASPSHQVSNIPSQLPPRIIPSSQLPPISSVNAVTNKISQLNVHHQSVIRPQFTSSPNEGINLPNKNINIGAGDFSPITSKIEHNTGLPQQNFQDIPLNEEKTVSNISSFTEKYLLDTQLKKENQNMVHAKQQQEISKTSNSNIFENKFPQLLQTNANNQLFSNENTRNFSSSTKSSQKICSQTQSKDVDPHQNGKDYLQSQNQRQSVFQSVPQMNYASQHFQNLPNAEFNVRGQPQGTVQLKHPSGSFAGAPFSASSGGNLYNASLPVRSHQSIPPNSNKMSGHFNQADALSNRTATNFPLQTQQIQASIPSTMARQTFNLNAMINHQQGNIQPVNQPISQSINQSINISTSVNPSQLDSMTTVSQSMVPLTPISQMQGNLRPISQMQSNLPSMIQPGRVKVQAQVASPEPLNRNSTFISTNVSHQNRMPPVNQAIPISAQNYSDGTAKNMLHTNRYPNLPSHLSRPTNPQQPYGQTIQSQTIQNQQYDVSSHGIKESNYNQYQNVVSHGFNKLWGAETFDLLQTSNILPSDKIEPPQIMLGNDTLNSANCSGQIFRSTITKIPESQNLLQKSRLPLGILIHPFKDLTQLSVIQCNVIVRCRACRTYINPYVFFVDSKRWKCNLCYRINDLPEEFQYDPVSKTYGDPSRRPEIKASTIEYIAPAEYMLRPPQPAVYLFLLDVSRFAIESGYLNIFCSVLLDELVNLPGDSRTQVGFITYDSSLHFFSFAEGLSLPHEMLVLDIDDIFLPCPDNLLVNLKDRMELIRDLLQQLPIRYNNNFDCNSALGAALQAAHRMMSATGGRVTVFQASLPNIGPGALTPREDPNQRSSAEVQNLKPANDFYKRLALECSSQQIAVDLFILNSQYVDIATISGISRFSGGCVHHFPLFKFGRPILTESLEKCIKRYITRKIGFEAVMRIRCTRGLSIHTFHGNFFVRSTDLLSLPNVNPDAGYGMQVSIDENLSDVESVCFQAALLYTSSKGERRIRVHTLCLPVVSTLHDVINSADQQCIIGLLAKMAVDRSVESSLSDAREAFINVVIDILSSYKLSLNLGSSPNGLLAPNCLKLLPLYISALLKHQAFRTGTSTRLDDRVKAMIDMKTKPLPWLLQNIYPDLYAIHNLEEQQVILNMEEESVHVPPHLQLTSRLIDNIGAYLMDTGDHMMLYVCSGVSQVFLKEGLGVPNFSSLNDQLYDIPILENQTNQRLHCFINYLNEDKPYRATMQIIKDNSPNRSVFLERLIEDRVENALSYHEFLQHVKAQVK